MVSISSFKILLSVILVFNYASASKLQLSEEKRVGLEKIHKAIAHLPIPAYIKTDSYLINFLRSRSYLDSYGALQLLMESLAWKNVNNIYATINETHVVSPGYVVSTTSLDNEGRPIVTKSMKHLDLKQLIQNGEKDEFLRYNFQILERMAGRARRISELSGENIDQIYSIVDFAGFDTEKHDCEECRETMVSLHSEIMENYPGLRFREVWINTPLSAAPLVKDIRLLYAETTNEDFKVFGEDREEWSRFLFKDISPDQLTFQFGGTKYTSDFLNAIE